MCYAKITNASTHERTQSLDMWDCAITQLCSARSCVVSHCIPHSLRREFPVIPV